MFISKYLNFHQEKSEKTLSNWRPDYDIVPDFISNTYYLKIRIIEVAKSTIDFDGDIELD